jgi:hypothetical protein
MSALNVLLQRDSVHVISDGASYDPDGRLAFPTTKVMILPHLNAIVSGRGPALGPAVMSQMLGVVGDSYDSMKAGAVECFRESLPLFRPILQQAGISSKIEVLVAGISESNGPDAFLICNHDDYGFPALSIIDLGNLSILPSEGAPEFLASLPNGTETDPEDIDPAVDGLRLLECQRRIVTSNETGDFVITGSFAQLTTVRADGISTRILKRWNDVRGERVGANQ